MKKFWIVLVILLVIGLIIGLVIYFSPAAKAKTGDVTIAPSPVISPYPVSNTPHPPVTISTHPNSVRVVPGERAVAMITGGPVYDYTNQDQIVEYTNAGIGLGYIISPEGDQYISVGDEKNGTKKYLVENKYIHSQS